MDDLTFHSSNKSCFVKTHTFPIYSNIHTGIYTVWLYTDATVWHHAAVCCVCSPPPSAFIGGTQTNFKSAYHMLYQSV